MIPAFISAFVEVCRAPRVSGMFRIAVHFRSCLFCVLCRNSRVGLHCAPAHKFRYMPFQQASLELARHPCCIVKTLSSTVRYRLQACTMAPKKRSAAEKNPSSSSQPPPKKAALKQGEPSPPSEPPSSKPARNEPEDYPEPPEAIFDAEIDLAATIATNAAAFQGNLALETHLQQWGRFVVTKLGEDQRVAVHVVAAFVEGERSEGLLTSQGESSAAEGSADAAGPSDSLGARVKSIGELMGGLAGRGHDCLKVDPAAPRDSTANRTLSVEDATLYVLHCYAERMHSALRGRPSDEVRGGEEGEEGEGFGGALPMVWAEQLAAWEAEGVDERERYERMGRIIERCLPGLPVFVMKNGRRYLSTTHLKYVLGTEKRPYELFRMLRKDSESESDSEDSAGDDESDPPSETGTGDKMLTAGDGGRSSSRALLDPASNQMVLALSTLVPTSSSEELAQVVFKSALERGDDVTAVTKIARNQVVALQGDEMGDRFRAATIRLLAQHLEAAMVDGPPPEAFAAMDARKRASEKERGAAQAAQGTGARSPSRPGRGGAESPIADSKGKRVAPERLSRPGTDAGSTAGGSGGDLEPGPGEAEYLDEADPEGEEDLMEDDWDVLRDDRPGFNPAAPVPIKTLGEISRFWKEFVVPNQVVVMQRHYNSDFERRYHGSHNLWTFKVLSNIMPVSRFLKAAPSSETFIALDLARKRLEAYGAKDDRNFGRSTSIAAWVHSEGVQVDGDLVHAFSSDLLAMARELAARRQGPGAGSASGSGAAAGPATSEEERLQQLASALARQDSLHARAARANATMAAVQEAKERLESGGM